MKKSINTALAGLALMLVLASGCAAQVVRVRMQVGGYLCNF